MEHDKLDRLTKGRLTKKPTTEYSRNNSLNATKFSKLKKATRFFMPLLANLGKQA